MNDTMAGTAEAWTYEQLCDSCRELSAEIDNRRWVIGDTALEIETRYGHHTMEDFARDIGQNKSTVSGWKRVARFYPNNIRADLFQELPNLTYTYYKDALRLEGIDPAIEWLQEVSNNGWSADEAARFLTERLGRQTRDTIEGVVSRSYTQEDGRYVTIRLNNESVLTVGQTVTIKAG